MYKRQAYTYAASAQDGVPNISATSASISVTAAASTGNFNFHPGDYARAYQPGGAGWGGSVASNCSFVDLYTANPISGGFVFQFSAADFEQGSTIDQGPSAVAHAQQGVGNFAGLTTYVAPTINYLSLIHI